MMMMMMMMIIMMMMQVRAAEDGLGGLRVPLRPVLQRRHPGEVRPRAQVRARPEAGRPPHPPARSLQRPQLRQQGRDRILIQRQLFLYENLFYRK